MVQCTGVTTQKKYQALRNACIGRKLATTKENGYMCPVPFCAKPGDAIFMFRGGEVLYAIRPTPTGSYHFVGETYVHGLMDGKAIMPLVRGESTLERIVLEPGSNPPASASPSFKENALTRSRTEIMPKVVMHNVSHSNEHMQPYVHEDGDERSWITSLVDGMKVATQERGVFSHDDQTLARQVEKLSISDSDMNTHASILYRDRDRNLRTRQQGSGMPVKEPEKEGDMPATELEQVPQEDDEALAQRLQAEEWAGNPSSDENTNSSLGNPIHPHQPASQTNTGTTIVSVAGVQPEKLERRASRTPFSPLPPRRAERLVLGYSRGPRTTFYHFSSKRQEEDFKRELYEATGIGLVDSGQLPPPPILFGRYIHDLSVRPLVVINTYGQPGEMRWEDDEWNVLSNEPEPAASAVDGVDGFEAAIEVAILASLESYTEDRHVEVAEEEWERSGEAKLPRDFELDENWDIPTGFEIEEGDQPVS